MLHDECLRGAKFVSRLLEALGAEVKMAQPYDGKNPVVLGRLGNNSNHPTGARHRRSALCLFVDWRCAEWLGVCAPIHQPDNN